MYVNIFALNSKIDGAFSSFKCLGSLDHSTLNAFMMGPKYRSLSYSEINFSNKMYRNSTLFAKASSCIETWGTLSNKLHSTCISYDIKMIGNIPKPQRFSQHSTAGLLGFGFKKPYLKSWFSVIIGKTILQNSTQKCLETSPDRAGYAHFQCNQPQHQNGSFNWTQLLCLYCSHSDALMSHHCWSGKRQRAHKETYFSLELRGSLTRLWWSSILQIIYRNNWTTWAVQDLLFLTFFIPILSILLLAKARVIGKSFLTQFYHQRRSFLSLHRK